MANPLLKDDVFNVGGTSQQSMTISGTINKSFVLWALLIASALYSWTHAYTMTPFMFPALIAGLVFAMVSIFKKTATPFTAPLYAICEGVVLGIVSLSFERSYPGIVMNAILLTTCVMFCMLAAYKTGILRATPMFKKVVLLSMFAIVGVYLIDILLNMFGGRAFPYLHDSSGIGILISFVIVGVAAMNLIIDFDMIEGGAQHGAPKFMEWYCAFALMVTLVWLYLEMLRLLSKMRK